MTVQAIRTAMRTDRWTSWHAVAATVMAALGVLATWSAWEDIFTIAYNDEEYSHVFLVPLVAFWMVWVRRMRFRHCKPTDTFLGPVIAAAGWAISSYGFYHGYQSLWHGGSVLVVIGCVIAVLGKHALFRFFPAVAVLIFLIPVPGTIRQAIAQPLQTWTAQIANGLLLVFGVDTERWGNMLVVNGKQVTIAEACNGVRGVFALVLVSYAFSFGLPLRNSVRFLVLWPARWPRSSATCCGSCPRRGCTGTFRRTRTSAGSSTTPRAGPCSPSRSWHCWGSSRS